MDKFTFACERARSKQAIVTDQNFGFKFVRVPVRGVVCGEFKESELPVSGELQSATPMSNAFATQTMQTKIIVEGISAHLALPASRRRHKCSSYLLLRVLPRERGR